MLPVRTHTAVMRQLDADCALLERLNVMDYSLLLGVHFVRWGNERWSPPFGDWGAAEAEPPAPDGHTWGRGCDARSLAAILRSAEEESGLGEAVRSAASMLTRVGRTSVAAWESAVRLSLPKGDGPASAPRPQVCLGGECGALLFWRGTVQGCCSCSCRGKGCWTWGGGPRLAADLPPSRGSRCLDGGGAGSGF